MDETYTLVSQIRSLNKIFRLACSQVILLNQRITMMKARYDRAVCESRRSFRYTNRLKLCAIEGVRNMYYEYACRKCDEIEDLQGQLQTLTGTEFNIDDTTDDDDDDDDDSSNDDTENDMDGPLNDHGDDDTTGSQNDENDRDSAIASPSSNPELTAPSQASVVSPPSASSK